MAASDGVYWLYFIYNQSVAQFWGSWEAFQVRWNGEEFKVSFRLKNFQLLTL